VTVSAEAPGVVSDASAAVESEIKMQGMEPASHTAKLDVASSRATRDEGLGHGPTMMPDLLLPHPKQPTSFVGCLTGYLRWNTAALDEA
jgi:hypothetical protein